jgi:hypothetical protein
LTATVIISECRKNTYLKKCDICDTGNPWLRTSLKELMVIIPTDKVLEIVLDYLAYDQEVREFIVRIQSEEFPRIHKTVGYLNEYTYVSAFT